MKITPVDLKKIDERSANIYEAAIVAAKRARQINDDNRLEYNTLVNQIVTTPEDEFEDKANPDLIRISVEFEKKHKAHQYAMDELLNGQIQYRYKDTE
ncbi:MAG: DNA-directed RNA polymerase subunit omega [Bacteroidetes bacterium]|nr:DNA-directed RNA polymerase subunit omega [Bacteroidota bacterium]MBU1678605.1 DNA-directed RNA polymerase subunit omega [Bacteroidota bacterium]MBU2506823.1 DNA-directed RNA polymerase subunit omega [Bacteroidota bacterium]